MARGTLRGSANISRLAVTGDSCLELRNPISAPPAIRHARGIYISVEIRLDPDRAVALILNVPGIHSPTQVCKPSSIIDYRLPFDRLSRRGH
jgi:hypothetical protein